MQFDTNKCILLISKAIAHFFKYNIKDLKELRKKI